MPPPLKTRLDAFAEDCSRQLGDLLEGVVVTGEVLEWEEVPPGAAVELLVLLQELTPEALRRLREVLRRWERRLSLDPVALSSHERRRSLDVFPLDYARAQVEYVVLWGQDPLQDMEIPLHALRLQLEQELKTLLFQSRRAYLLARKPGDVQQWMRGSLDQLDRLLWGLLYLQGRREPLHEEALLRAVAEAYQLRLEPWLELWRHVRERRRWSPEEAEERFAVHLRKLELLADQVDRMMEG